MSYLKQTSSEKAKHLLQMEVFYWGQKGLETTQRAAHTCSRIRGEMIEIGASEEVLDYWSEVLKEIYKQGK